MVKCADKTEQLGVNKSMMLDQPFTNATISKKKVLLRAPALTQSGYGVHSRQIARWLLSLSEVDVKFQALHWGNTPWIINKDFYDGLIGDLMNRSVDPTGQHYDVSIQVQLPNEWDSSLATKNIGITAVVETDICNPDWIRACNRMTCIIVPSHHCKKVLENSGKLTVPVHVVPESFPDVVNQNLPTKIDELKFQTDFNFLVVGQITGKNAESDRKNIFYTIKWFCENFQDDENVGLVLKTNMGRNTKIDRKIVASTLRAVLAEINKKVFPRVYLIHGELSDAEMTSLYKHPQIKALISLTRGEGFGLPILEAAACSLPVIATNWSGHLDFLNRGKFISIDYKIDNVHSSRVDNEIFVKNSKWANPLGDDFKKKITKFRNAHSTPKDWAIDLSKKIIENYSFQEISKNYSEVLREIL